MDNADDVLREQERERDMIEPDEYSSFVLDMLPKTKGMPKSLFLSSHTFNDAARLKSVSALAASATAWYAMDGFSRLRIFEEGVLLGSIAKRGEPIWRVKVEEFTFFFCGTQQQVGNIIASLPTPLDEQQNEIDALEAI